jgi:RNA polymerase sigma-70 factor (ECF subfamily)
MEESAHPEDSPDADRQFRTTRWTQVRKANNHDLPGAAEALSQLCREYWYPLYAYVRRRGCSHADAEDLTQDFFARLLDKQSLQRADSNRGRFRSFLLASIDHFLCNEWAKRKAQKRGGQ